MRNFIVFVVSTILFTPNLSAQLKWSFETSVEESFIIGDQLPSFNPISINDLANNSGARVGAKVDFKDKYFGRVSLGVIEAGRIGYYQTKLVPVELSGGIHFYSMNTSDKYPMQWNADISVGSSFVRAQSESYNRAGNNSLSENIGLGLSLDVLQTQQSLISIGYRHYFFWGDNLDALQEKGGMDQLSRFYLNSSFDISSPNPGIIVNSRIGRLFESISWYTSVEESFVLGDQFSSFNLLNLSNAANNSGIRTGLSASVNEKFGIQATFGVVGSARLNGFSTNLIPVELLGRYSFYSMGQSERFPLTWSGEIGPGISLVRSQTSTNNIKGVNSVSNNLTLGLSLDVLKIDGNDISIGYRHTLYGDDNIDGKIADGGIDQLSRWQLGYRINLLTKNSKNDPIIDPAEPTLDEESTEPSKREKQGKKTFKERIAAIRELNKTNLNSTIVEIESLEDNTSDNRFSHMDSVPEVVNHDEIESVDVNDDNVATSEKSSFSTNTKKQQTSNKALVSDSSVEQRIESMSSEIEELKGLIKSLLSDRDNEVVADKKEKQETIEKLKTLSKEIETILKSLEGDNATVSATKLRSPDPTEPIAVTKAEASQPESEPEPKRDFKEINVSKKNQLSRKDGYAIILKTFDSAEEAQDYASKISRSLGKPFVWELIPLKKYRVVLGVYTDNYQMLYKVEELKYYGYSPWVTRWH